MLNVDLAKTVHESRSEKEQSQTHAAFAVNKLSAELIDVDVLVRDPESVLHSMVNAILEMWSDRRLSNGVLFD